MEFSIIVPAFNEEGNVQPLYQKILEAMNSIKATFEIIFVDDGSSDKTASRVEELRKKDKRVHLIQFARNFGKASALSAGMREAKGNIVVTIDADLQDDPFEIPRMREKLNQGYDLVVGWKYKRKDPFLTKRLPSKLFNFAIRFFHKIKLHDSDCNFRMMRRELAKELLFYGGLFRYIPSLAHWRGYKITEIPVVHHKRFSGKSKWGLSRLFKGTLDLFTVTFLLRYKNSPLYLFGAFGGILFALGFIAGLILLYDKYVLDQLIANRPLLLLAVLFIMLGAQFIFFGLLGEMMTHATQKDEVNYRIKKRL